MSVLFILVTFAKFIVIGWLLLPPQVPNTISSVGSLHLIIFVAFLECLSCSSLLICSCVTSWY
jgi:hypothetical protein